MVTHKTGKIDEKFLEETQQCSKQFKKRNLLTHSLKVKGPEQGRG